MFVEQRDSQGWVLKALREAGNSVVSEFSGLDEDTACQRPTDDELCLKELAAHMRDAEELAVLQIMSLVETPRKTLPIWDIDSLPMERDYRSGDLRMLLTEFRRMRQDTTQVLWGLTHSEWRRSGKHPYRGDLNIETIARELAQHDLEHLWQIRRLKYDLNGTVNVSADWDTDDR